MFFGVNVTVVPLTLMLPFAGVAKIDTPVGVKAGNMQGLRSMVVAVFSGTVITQADGAGRPMLKGTESAPVLIRLAAVKIVVTGPGTVGVPEMMPVTESITRPAGRLLPG